MSVEIRVPQMGESIVEATLARWIKREGDRVSAGEPIAELETDKVNMEVTADQAGVLEALRVHEGDTVAVNDVIAILSTASNGSAPSDVPAEASLPTVVEAAGGSTREMERSVGAPEVRASPLAVRMARENDIDLSVVQGSGAGGKIVQRDVQAALQARSSEGRKLKVPPAVEGPVEPAPVVVERVPRSPDVLVPPAELREERVRMSRRRQTIAARLKEAQNTAAMLTTFNEIDMSAVMELRKRRRDAFKERYGVSLGFMSFFTKACVGALKAFPYLNAEIQGNEIVLKRYYDIGIAVGVEEGLVVPVVRDADRKTFAEIEKEIADLATRARENKLALSELQGGTFTITNGGVFGSLMSTPILNFPQVGILGMHKIQERPVVVSGEVVIRPMMYVALSYDHRIVDGNDAVRFLVRVKELIEDPEVLLLEG